MWTNAWKQWFHIKSSFSLFIKLFSIILPSDKGQALILSAMLVVVTKGPLENFNYNSQVLAVSGLCAQEKLLVSTKDLIDYYKRPLRGTCMYDIVAW